MRGYYQNRQWGDGSSGFGRGLLPSGIRLLLIANVAVFVIQVLSQPRGEGIGPLSPLLGLVPAMVVQGAVWQLFTYMFLHGGFFHILFNMFVLWMFGRDLELEWGTRAFLKFYLVCGVGAGLVTVLFQPGQSIPTIGASGAIFGVLLAFALAYPNRQITLLLFFVLPVTMKAKYLVGGIAILQLLLLRTGEGGIAYLTHLGGLATAFLYLKLGGRRLRLPRPFAWLGRIRARRKGRKLRKQWDAHRDLMEAVDRVLDRINEVGYDQLTDEEKRTLEQASQRLSAQRENH